MTNNSISDKLWTERYRPQTISQALLPNRIRELLSNENITNYLFSGTQGSGKTTLAKCISREHDVLFINGSLENGIDKVRNDITNFCTHRSMKATKSVKIVVIDEADYFTQTAQASLRGTIEMYVSTTRFILTCNYPARLIEPLRSRFMHINFDFSGDEETEQMKNYLRRIIDICNANSMKISTTACKKLIKVYYPDLRAIVNKLQELHNSGIMDINETNLVIENESNAEYTDLFELVVKESNPVSFYQYASLYKTRELNVINAFSQDFCDYIITAHPAQQKNLGKLAIVIHKYSFEVNSVIDPFVTLLAMLYEVSLHCKS